MPQGDIWLYRNDRLWTTTEMLVSHGFDYARYHHTLEGLSQAEIQQIAGNSINAYCYAPIVLSTLTHLPFDWSHVGAPVGGSSSSTQVPETMSKVGVPETSGSMSTSDSD